jgi:hypothetical protein
MLKNKLVFLLSALVSIEAHSMDVARQAHVPLTRGELQSVRHAFAIHVKSRGATPTIPEGHSRVDQFLGAVLFQVVRQHRVSWFCSVTYRS